MTSKIALVIEQLLPGDRIGQVTERSLQFLHNGVPLVWLVNSEERIMIVYRKGESTELFYEDEELTGTYVYPDAPFRVSELLSIGEE